MTNIRNSTSPNRKLLVTVIVTLVIVLLAGSIGYFTYHKMKMAKIAKSGLVYYEVFQALDQNRLDVAQEKLKEMSDDQDNYNAASMIQKATIMEANNELGEAMALYSKIEDMPSVAAYIKEAAFLKKLALKLYHSKDQVSEADIIKLQNLTKSGVFKYSAMEMLGYAYIRNNLNQYAKEVLESLINDPDAPTYLVERNRLIVTIL